MVIAGDQVSSASRSASPRASAPGCGALNSAPLPRCLIRFLTTPSSAATPWPLKLERFELVSPRSAMTLGCNLKEPDRIAEVDRLRHAMEAYR